ncbi:MAG: putative capsid protein [Cressdnaviricota sp.]|nr:MAG: putative capsid protein [Cressdnaviricota sp.]
MLYAYLTSSDIDRGVDEGDPTDALKVIYSYIRFIVKTDNNNRIMSSYRKKKGTKRGGRLSGATALKRFGNFKRNLRSTGRATGAVSASTLRSVIRRAQGEIKYDDDYYNLNAWLAYGVAVSGLQVGFANWVLGGVVSNGIATIVSGGGVTGYLQEKRYVPNCLTNVFSGTSAKTRIGNVITPRYITLRGVINAALTNGPLDPETLGKTEPGSSPETLIQRYLRTSVKLILVRDKNMNEKGYVSYADLFEMPDDNNGLNGFAGQNPFVWPRKIDTIGRYQVIRTWEYELDADDPQQSFTHVVNIGGMPIRYNGAASRHYVALQAGMGGVDYAEWMTDAGVVIPGTAGPVSQSSTEVQSMTNGVYLLAVAHTTQPIGGPAPSFTSPSMVFSTRMTFNDN